MSGFLVRLIAKFMPIFGQRFFRGHPRPDCFDSEQLFHPLHPFETDGKTEYLFQYRGRVVVK
jgi:hypothetical protein